MGLIDDLTSVANDILSVRDTVGAVIHPVFIVVRTWSGGEPGKGTYADVETQVLPSPGIKDVLHTDRALVAGSYKQGDLLLRHISKQSYPLESDIDCTSAQSDVERFYKINDHYYNVVKVDEDYISWHVQIRRLSGT